MTLTIVVEPHPLLDAGAFLIQLARPLGELATPEAIAQLARPDVRVPLEPVDPGKPVRDLLRHGGFKPAGRSKPASEYLVGAVVDGRFPQINALVDTCNVVSLHAGLPISLVDLDRVEGALAIRIAPPATSYVFNPSGQVIDASGLVCLFDASGPTGTPVKDAQRTKTSAATRAAIVIVWGTRALVGRTAATTRWYRELVAKIDGASTQDVALVQREL
ncbi:MAG: phenylalanine--tRNA ligase beta subunit-related protein [Kofleriaceae bacterium]